MLPILVSHLSSKAQEQPISLCVSTERQETLQPSCLLFTNYISPSIKLLRDFGLIMHIFALAVYVSMMECETLINKQCKAAVNKCLTLVYLCREHVSSVWGNATIILNLFGCVLFIWGSFQGGTDAQQCLFVGVWVCVLPLQPAPNTITAQAVVWQGQAVS